MNQQTRLIFTTMTYMQELQNKPEVSVTVEEKPRRKFNFRFWSRKQASKISSHQRPVLLTSAESKA